VPLALLAKLIPDPSRPWKQKWLKKDWLMTTLDNMSVAKALETICKVKRKELLWKMIEFKLVNDEVAALDEMNFLGLLCKVRGGQGKRFGAGLPPILMGYWDELEIFSCADGCQELARKMEEEINKKKGCKVDPDRMVRAIDIKDREVKVTWVPVKEGKPVVSPGERESFEFVILAIPPSVWTDVEITVGGKTITPEGKPAHPKDAIGLMGMAPAVKFFTDVKKRFWINEEQKTVPYGGSLRIGQVWEGTDNQTRINRDPQVRPLENDKKQGIVLSVFAGPILPGPPPRVPTEDEFKKELKRLYPGYDDIHTKPPLFANWPIVPFIMTGYVSPTKNQILTIGQKLNNPYHERLFFAGEHTQMDSFGYMEGALRSGERAANTLMLKACGLLKEPAPKSPSPPQKPALKPPQSPDFGPRHAGNNGFRARGWNPIGGALVHRLSGDRRVSFPPSRALRQGVRGGVGTTCGGAGSGEPVRRRPRGRAHRSVRMRRSSNRQSAPGSLP
jgi:monoamine oxidase